MGFAYFSEFFAPACSAVKIIRFGFSPRGDRCNIRVYLLEEELNSLVIRYMEWDFSEKLVLDFNAIVIGFDFSGWRAKYVSRWQAREWGEGARPIARGNKRLFNIAEKSVPVINQVFSFGRSALDEVHPHPGSKYFFDFEWVFE